MSTEERDIISTAPVKDQLQGERNMKDFMKGLVTGPWNLMKGQAPSITNTGGTPPRTPSDSPRGDGSFGGRMEAIRDSFFFKLLMLIAFAFFALYVLGVLNGYRKERSEAEMRQDQLVLETELKRAEVNARIAALQNTARVSPIAQQEDLSVISPFACSTQEERDSGFASEGSHVLTSGAKITQGGCAWVEVQFPVKRVSGNNFTMDLLDRNDSSVSLKCGKNAPSDSMNCVDLLNYVRKNNDYSDKRVQVTIYNGGSVSIQ